MRETVYEMYLQGCCLYYFIANLPPKGAIRFIQQDRMARQKVKSAVKQKIIASKDTVQTQYPETVIALDKVKSSASKMSAEMSGAIKKLGKCMKLPKECHLKLLTDSPFSF